jgi:transposase InsO family protein
MKRPRHLIRDRDRIYGSVVTRRLRAMGIRDKPTAPASPWQNGFAERLIGSIRRECVDHIIVLGEVHLRQFSNRTRAITMTSGRTGHWTKMHQSLAKFSESEASNHAPSLADFITTTSGSRFSVHAGVSRKFLVSLVHKPTARETSSEADGLDGGCEMLAVVHGASPNGEC